MGEGGKLGTIVNIVGSGLAVFALTTVYTQVINQPDINFDTLSDENGTYNISFTNGGIASATNFVLTAESPVKINDYQVFSTEDWAEGKKDENSLSIHFSRVAQGGGSLTKIMIFTDTTSSKSGTGYTVYATYDQGSLRANGGAMPFVVAPTNTQYSLPIFLIISAIVSFSIPVLYRRFKRVAAKVYKSKASLNKELEATRDMVAFSIIVLVVSLLIPWSIYSNLISGNPFQWTEKFDNNHIIITIIALIIFGFFLVVSFSFATSPQVKKSKQKHTP